MVYEDVTKNSYYKENIKKPEAHFFPDLSEEATKNDTFDFGLTLSYSECTLKIVNKETFYTTQMIFATVQTGITHDIYIHYVNEKESSQKIARVEFSSMGKMMIKEWV